jgi:hypothetical protein
MSYRRHRIKSGWHVVLLDFLGLAVALNIFALFHHVLPTYIGKSQMHIVSVGSAAVDSSPSVSPATTEIPMLVLTEPSETASLQLIYAPGDFSANFPSEGTGGTLWSYQTDNVRIAIDKLETSDVTGYIADVWVRNISFFKTGFAKGTYGKGIREYPQDTANDYSAILAITGDYYGAREKGIVIRNGDLYRDSVNADTCVLYADGVMETYYKADFDLDAAVARDAYQAWSFGPKLLKDGKALDTFDSQIQGLNPRCAIGYYEPGHYCFVVIDGRQPGYSKGATMQQLSKLFESLGCKDAYNLDGGQSAMMVFQGGIVNQPYNGGRKTSDIIYIGGDAP